MNSEKVSVAAKLPDPYYVVVTSRGEWGGGGTLLEAAKIANAVGMDHTRVKRGVKCVCYSLTGHNELPMTADDLNPNKNGGLSYTGYSVGDYLKPWVTQYGSLVYKGEIKQKFEMGGGEALPQA